MRKALFLDRDGVVNVEKNYVYRIEDFEFIDGIFELARAAQDAGYLLIVITNQAGIARGYYTEEDYHKLTRWMVDEFARRGIRIAQVYYCPFHPEAGLGRYKADSWDRKPNPGMLLRAKNEFDLDLKKSILVGNKVSDIEAGRHAGVGRLILLSENTYRADFNSIITVPTLDVVKVFLFEYRVEKNKS